MTTTTASTKANRKKVSDVHADDAPPRRSFYYAPGSHGVDRTFDIICRETNLVVAAFGYWEAEAKARRGAQKLTAALNAFYQHGGDLRVWAFLRSHDLLADPTWNWGPADDIPTPFDDFEIHGVVEVDGICETVPDDEAQFWSLYGHIPGQGVDCIGDFKSREHAEEIYSRITGRPYSTSNTKGV